MSPAALSGLDPATGLPIVVEIEDGIIAHVRPGDAGESLYLSPGLVDLQVNGYAGIDLNAPALSAPDVSALAARLAGLGVTTCLPTLVTAPEQAIVAALRAIAEARRHDPLVAHMMPFAHVEGPSVSPEDGPRGAHRRDQVRPPDLGEFERWQAASGDLVGMVTLSPHWPDAPAYIAELVARGVQVSLGHTHADPARVREAVDAGARLSTHLGNGAAATLPRHPNFIWTQLADDRLTATFIADGHHLPADALKAMIRAKGIERAILVSDTAALGGMPPGTYEQPIGGRVTLSADGRLGMADTPYLAGAARALPEDVAIAMRFTELPLADALAMATRNPGRFVAGRGVLEPGAPADLIRFAWAPGAQRLDIRTVLVAGREIDR